MLTYKQATKSLFAEVLEGASLLIGVGVCGMIAGWLRVLAILLHTRGGAAQFTDHADSIIDFLIASGVVVPPGLILLLWATILYRRRQPEGECSPALSLSWWIWGFNLLIGGPLLVCLLLMPILILV